MNDQRNRRISISSIFREGIEVALLKNATCLLAAFKVCVFLRIKVAVMYNYQKTHTLNAANRQVAFLSSATCIPYLKID